MVISFTIPSLVEVLLGNSLSYLDEVKVSGKRELVTSVAVAALVKLLS